MPTRFQTIVSGVTLAFFFCNAHAAWAVPSFSRQTGMECSACHVGSFGPQLTAVGRQFKLQAYKMQVGQVDTDSDGSDSRDKLTPDGKAKLAQYLKNLSMTALAGIEHTKGDLRKGTELEGNKERLKTNNNVTLDEVAIFYAGPLSSTVGMFTHVEYSQPEEHFSWGHAEVRFADTAKLGGQALVYGVTLNNNPSVQDLWNTTPVWGFPYLSSELAPELAAEPFMRSLAGRVAGASVYAMWNDWLYTELAGYMSLPNKTQLILGKSNAAQNDHLSGLAPYWRVAAQHDFGPHYVEVGTFGLAASRYPGNMRGLGTDDFIDYGVDGTYMFTSDDGRHTVAAYGSALHEDADLNASFINGDVARATSSLNDYAANLSYYYDNSYGFTFGPFRTTGSADATLYSSPNSRPDTNGWRFQVDYTPTGTAESYAYPNLNARFFLQYTAYNKFNGVSRNYDGTGRTASDNDMLYGGVWFAF